MSETSSHFNKLEPCVNAIYNVIHRAQVRGVVSSLACDEW